MKFDTMSMLANETVFENVTTSGSADAIGLAGVPAAPLNAVIDTTAGGVTSKGEIGGGSLVWARCGVTVCAETNAPNIATTPVTIIRLRCTVVPQKWGRGEVARATRPIRASTHKH